MTRRWPYLATPLHLYLAVMLPICALMGWIVASPHRAGIRATAAGVIAFSAVGLLRGYGRGLKADARGVCFQSLTRRIRIDWSSVRRVDVYVPSGAVNGARYVYVTTRDEPPAGISRIDDHTVQIQDRPGLLESLRHLRDQASAQK